LENLDLYDNPIREFSVIRKLKNLKNRRALINYFMQRGYDEKK